MYLSLWEASTGGLIWQGQNWEDWTNGPVWYPSCFLICDKSTDHKEHVERVEEISASTLY